MKKHLLAACIAALSIAPAMAADFPVKAAAPLPVSPIYNWSGIYVGLNAGGGQSHNCWTQKGFNIPIVSIAGSPFFGVSNVSNASEGCNTATGAIAGGQVGYRYQLNNFVFGIEGQGDWANLSASNSSPAINGVNTFLTNLATTPPSGATLVNNSKVDAIGMFTGQAGYSFGPLLWYVKGGAAVTDNKYNGAVAANVGTASVTATDAGRAVRFGGVVGTGLDWMFAPGWSVGIDYNHLFMGSQQVGLAYTGNTVKVPGLTAGNIVGIPSRTESVSGDIDMATVRLNYSFGAR